MYPSHLAHQARSATGSAPQDSDPATSLWQDICLQAGQTHQIFHSRWGQLVHFLQVLRDKLLAEAEESVRLNADVAARWAQLFRLEVPQELHQEMQSQQAACDEIIASKDAIVADMRAQLHQKDDEYVRMLKQQGEDVDSLLASMQKQLEDMQEAYRDELTQIDEAYMQVVMPWAFRLLRLI